MALQKYFSAWHKKEHASSFDHVMFFMRRFENYNEIKLLNSIKKNRKERFSLLEIGCATGEFYRYFRYKYPNVEYMGCDVSRVAIERAREKFPRAIFFAVDENLTQIGHIQPNVIFCRDVVMHQPDPFHFLKEISNFSAETIIFRLRTRDKGKSVLDPEISCQRHYQEWVPYLILNCDELVSFLRGARPIISRIVFAKNYKVLGGQYSRYLPKDCYVEETGTAETALLIEKGKESSTRGCSGFFKVEEIPNGEKNQSLTTRKVFSLLKRFF